MVDLDTYVRTEFYSFYYIFKSSSSIILFNSCMYICSSGSAKMEEAADLYVRAANAYKVGKRYRG